jgi:hypothetical protein
VRVSNKSSLAYRYHFELCERPELPGWFRQDIFASLGWIQSTFGLKGVLENTVPEIVQAACANKIFELGSGSGDGIAHVARSVGPDVEVMATDLFPNPDMWRERLSGISNASYCDQPVSFENYHEVLDRHQLGGNIVLLVAAFHHVPTDQARVFLERAAQKKAHVLIIEPLSRTAKGLALGGLAAIPSFAAPFAAKNLPMKQRLRSFAMHWLLPLIPLSLMHDGMISALRQRTTDEMKELAKGLPFELESRTQLGPFRNYTTVLFCNTESINRATRSAAPPRGR